MKKVLLTICYSILAFNLFAQSLEDKQKEIQKETDKSVSAAFANAIPSDTLRGWKRSTQFGINAAESSFSNWAAGGVNTGSLGLLFNHTANYLQDNWAWTNDMQFQYGLLNSNKKTRKSVDRMFLNSKYARKVAKNWNLFAELTFLSQFAKGYHYDANGNDDGGGFIASTFFSPAYFTEGLGLEYKPVSWFVLQLSPATVRQTIVANSDVFKNTAIRTTDPDNADKHLAYGVREGEKSFTQIGSQLIAALNKDIAKNVNLKARYGAFGAYNSRKGTSPISHRLDLIATAKVNKYLNVNFTLIGIYDEQVIKKIQINQGLAVGFLVSL